MNPYLQLSRLYNVNSLSAELRRVDGRIYQIRVEPEENRSETLNSDYPSAITVRAWSVDSELLRDEGIQYYPGDGDLLTVTGRDGVARSYLCAREATSSKFWRWRWDRSGGRIVFYTRFEEKK